MASKKIKLTSQTAWETQKDLNENFADIDDRLDAMPTKTSDLTNDGDGTSNFATESYVNQYGGKIDSISVNGVAQTIDANKNVDLTIDNNNQTVKAGNVTFGANDVVEIVGGTNVTVTGNDTNKTITLTSTDTGATSVELKSGDTGNAVTTMTYDSATRKITFEKGETFQTATDNTLNTTSKTVSGAINEVNSIAKQANQAKGFATYQALITELNSASATKYNVGQSFYVQTQEVPDLWIMSVESSSSSYTYTTDAAFITATAAAGGQQVGYYKLAQLETQKVDLTNYVQKSTTIAGVDLQDNITKSELLTALNVEDGAEVNDVADVQMDNTSLLDANKIAHIVTKNANYNASTNKLVTEADLGSVYSVGILDLLSQVDVQDFLSKAFVGNVDGTNVYSYQLASAISLANLDNADAVEIDFSAVSSLMQLDNFKLVLPKTSYPKTSSDSTVPVAYSATYNITDTNDNTSASFIITLTGMSGLLILSLTTIGNSQQVIEDISFTASDAGWSAVDANGFYTLTITSAKKPIAVYNTSGEQVLAGLKYDGTYVYVITDTKFSGLVTVR